MEMRHLFFKEGMFMNKNELLKYVTDHYLTSCDFNGVAVYNMPSFDVEDLVSLIQSEQLFIITDNDDINVHINRYNCYSDKETQITSVRKDHRYAIYPTTAHLATLDIREKKPFTAMIACGAEQFRVMYFAVDVLELYVNNPQYSIWDCGYRGNICLRDNASEDLLHSEYIRDFGVAYPHTEPKDGDRAIGVFLRDLSKLNFESQCKWRAFLLPDQSEFFVNSGFIKNLLHGGWVNKYWIFDALLDEIKLINSMCGSIGLPTLFCNEYSRDENELIGYRTLLIPSSKNYYEFVSALEKIVINNLNYKLFQQEALYIRPIERKKEDGTLKGSIEMLEEWFLVNYFSSNPNGNDAFKKYISGTFRNIRKIRQVPAHELYANKHDKGLYRKQNELIEEVYHAVRDIRMMFGKHPLAINIPIPDQLQNEENIVLY